MNDLQFYNDEDEGGTYISHPEDPDCDPEARGGTPISHPEDPSCSPD
jgi:hypothetical protein